MTDPTERRERAAAQYERGIADWSAEAFLAGCEWQHKTTIADVMAWFDKGCPGLDRELFVAFGPRGMVSAMREAIERGEAEGCAEEGRSPHQASLPELLRRGLAATSATAVEEFKRTGPTVLVSAWVCLELGADRGEREAAKAISCAVHLMVTHAKSHGSPRRIELTEELPLFGRKNLEHFGPAIERGLALYGQQPKEQPMDRLADVTIAYVPTADTPPGYMRLVVKHKDQVVYDETHDPIDAADILERVMRGDSELIGDVPSIPAPLGGSRDRPDPYRVKVGIHKLVKPARGSPQKP